MQAVSEDRTCFNCGYSQTVISADVMAEFEKNRNRRGLLNPNVKLPVLLPR